ncbi:MAG: DUF1249 domain-containing protein [Thiohalomonadales bacterium]
MNRLRKKTQHNMTSIHESNYWKLFRIVPHVKQIPSRRLITLPANQYKMTIGVDENTKYTSRVSFISYFSTSLACVPNLNLQVRMYHDACVAEVIEYQQNRNFDSRYDYPNDKMHQKNEKQQINFFLRDWLDFCINHGYIAQPGKAETDL